MRYTFDSREIRPGMGFVALKGEKADGHAFIPAALAAGAVEIVDGLEELQRKAHERRKELRAKVIGVTICYDPLPETEDENVLRLFSMAAEEAMTNAAKHGGAKNLYVHISEDEAALTASFQNDGNPPGKVFVEGGGLSTLREHIEQAGGTMQISLGEQFTLTVGIPKAHAAKNNFKTYPIG